jgi:hypothetical protein
MQTIKNSFVPVKRLYQGGKLFKDDDKAFYLVDHDHPALAGKEFVNAVQVAETIADWNRANPDNQFNDEIILQNIITYNL